MRTIGVAERALELMVPSGARAGDIRPAVSRIAVQDWIADARMNIDQARLYTLYTAWKMDK